MYSTINVNIESSHFLLRRMIGKSTRERETENEFLKVVVENQAMSLETKTSKNDRELLFSTLPTQWQVL